MRVLVAATAIVLCTPLAQGATGPYSKQPYIDPEYRDVDMRRVADEKKCRGDPLRALRCMKDVKRKYDATGDMRGTAEYVRKHWGSLSARELAQKISEETTLLLKARAAGTERAEPGEVTNTMFDAEIAHLQDLKGEKGGGYHPY